MRVFVAQMPVNLSDENFHVLVADPADNRHVVDPAHHRERNEVMAAIVEPERFQLRRRPGQFHGFPEGVGRFVIFAPLWAGEEPFGVGSPPAVHVAQMAFQSRV